MDCGINRKHLKSAVDRYTECLPMTPVAVAAMQMLPPQVAAAVAAAVLQRITDAATWPRHESRMRVCQPPRLLEEQALVARGPERFG
mmetsp:Transcript_57263/g.158540  ORF Transcript_57263/g.158540 Transcript_57263/m.158540 type:complete len:87 (-) Transcript_57263:220-480(-)